jgi:hypothetical protein
MRGDLDDPDEEEFRNDPLVRIAATIMDPSHGKPVPPASLTPVQLIQLAAQQRRSNARRRLKWLGAPTIVAALVAVVILAAADFFAGFRHAVPGLPAASYMPARVPQPPPVPLHLPSGKAAAARAQLVALVARTRACADRATPGRYTYVHTRTWSRRETSAVRDEQLWWAADHSGRQVVAEATVPATSGAPSTAGAPAFGNVGDYRAGELAVVVDTPSTDPPILASQLADYQPFATGPQAPLRAVVDLYRYHALDAAQRAAAIRVLADTTGLEYRGQVTDPDGRTGMAISVDSDRGATRDVAVFEAGTGRLLSYERDALRKAGAATAGVVDYVVFLGSGHTDELGQPAEVPVR